MTSKITVGGLPGTGTSTLCKRLQAKLDWPYVYAGQIFRDEATNRGMSLAEFGALCEADASVDKALDAKQVELLRDGPIILEGRLSGLLANQQDIEALKVWITCDDAERARRVTERDGGQVDEQMAKMQARESSERTRYEQYYGFELQDLSAYDLVLDSTRKSPDELAAAVLAEVQSV